MPDYVREQSVGELLRNGMSIYRRHFLAVFATYFVVCFPLAWLYMEASARRSINAGAALFFLNLLVISVATGALTILVSDICLGNSVSVGRAYKMLGAARSAKVLVTSLLGLLPFFFVAAFLIAFFEVAPLGVFATATTVVTAVGLFLVSSLLTAVPIVVLENRGGIAAIRRSWGLSTGLRRRNLQVVIVLLLVSLSFFVGAFVIAALPPGEFSDRRSNVVGLSAQFLLIPLVLVVVVLLYYDSRVRHEGYDTYALGDDLHH